jgi:hypothetical protein
MNDTYIHTIYIYNANTHTHTHTHTQTYPHPHPHTHTQALANNLDDFALLGKHPHLPNHNVFQWNDISILLLITPEYVSILLLIGQPPHVPNSRQVTLGLVSRISLRKILVSGRV